MSITLQDGGGFLWTVTCDQFGNLIVTKGSAGVAPAVFLNDAGSTVSWQLAISTTGVLSTTSVVLAPANPTLLPLTSAYNLGVRSLGQLQVIAIVPPPIVPASAPASLTRTGQLANGQVIPLTTSPNQKFSANLLVDGTALTLQFAISWNAMAGYWVMSVFNSSGTLLLDSIPLITGWYPGANILGQYGYLKIGSAYILNEGSSAADYPTSQDLGSGFVLVWGDTAP